MAQALASRPCRAKAVSLSSVIEARRRGSGRAEDGHHDRDRLGGGLAGEACREHEPGLALLEDQHRPGPPADQQVALPVPGLLAPLDALGPVVDGTPPGDGAVGLAGSPPAPPGPPTRQQLPELLALLPGPVDEGVDGLERDRAEP